MNCSKCGKPLKTEAIGEAGCYVHYCDNPKCKPSGFLSGVIKIGKRDSD